jgi:hypothetical protein
VIVARINPLDEAEWDLWSEFTNKMDNLHREVTRLDQSGKSGYIYLARMSFADDDPQTQIQRVKIGIAKNPSARIKHWSTARVKMPYRVQEIHVAWTEDMRLAERALHQVFRRFRTDGEWFLLPDHCVHALLGLWYVRANGDRLWFYDLNHIPHTLMGFLHSEFKQDAEFKRMLTKANRVQEEFHGEKESQ